MSLSTSCTSMKVSVITSILHTFSIVPTAVAVRSLLPVLFSVEDEYLRMLHATDYQFGGKELFSAFLPPAFVAARFSHEGEYLLMLHGADYQTGG